MKATLNWTEGMQFSVSAGQHQILVDAKSPLGKDTGMAPKELVVAGLGGCTAMDVVALLKKHKQVVESFSVDTDVKMSQGKYPTVFTEAKITFTATGNIDKNIFLDSVRLSQTQYCGVSAMLVKAFPIS